MKKTTKMMLMLVSLALVVGIAVGGTIAWLVTNTDPVINTFTPSTINIELEETTEDYEMVPGNEIDKDPYVTVKAGSEACWLFVKIEESDNYYEFLAPYEVDEEWTQLVDADGKAVEGVFYMEVEEVADGATEPEFAVLKDNKVTVLTSVTKEMMDAIITGTEDEPTLTFTAYAVQQANIASAYEAWETISDPNDDGIAG